LWNNELVFVFEFGTWLVITLNFVCVRLCELEKFGCVLVMFVLCLLSAKDSLC
jgi:hypothetical protein